jgi:MYXO-CTERM domain-containing protein
MELATRRFGLQVFAFAALVVAPATASAHAYVMSPPPRDIAQPDLDARAHKTGPCGGVPRTGKPTKYAPGATVTVKWQETIAHQGCYQIGFSQANDQNFTVLKQINDPAGGAGMVYTDTVTLPAGVTCPACTLVVRQLMVGGACVGNPADPAAAAQGTYYSCADICVGDTCTEPDAGTPIVDAGGTDGSTKPPVGSDSGVSTTPTDGGGKLVDAGDDDDDGAAPNLRSGDGGGCAVALGATSGVSAAAMAGLFGLALLRRRRNRKS